MLGHPEVAGCAGESLLEGDLDDVVHVLATRHKPGTASESAAAASEDGLEEVAETSRIGFGEATAAEVSPGMPAGRRPELLARAGAEPAELIVLGTLVGVAQHLVGLAELLEPVFGVRRAADVGMVLSRQTPVGTLDLIRGGVFRHPHDVVVVDELHVPNATDSVTKGCPSGALSAGRDMPCSYR
jgi:hypothetical protein